MYVSIQGATNKKQLARFNTHPKIFNNNINRDEDLLHMILYTSSENSRPEGRSRNDNLTT